MDCKALCISTRDMWLGERARSKSPVLTGACSCAEKTQSTQTQNISHVQIFLTSFPSNPNNTPPNAAEIVFVIIRQCSVQGYV